VTTRAPRSASLASTITVVSLATVSFATALALRDAVNVWLTTSIAAMVALMMTRLGDPEAFQEFRRLRARAAWAAVGIALLMIAATYLLYAESYRVPGLQPQVRELYLVFTSEPGRYGAAPIIAFVVLAEEVVWRGVLLRALEQRVGPLGQVVLATLLYSLMQAASGSWVLWGLSVLLGLVWTLQRVLYRTWAAPLITHLIWDGTVMILYPLH